MIGADVELETAATSIAEVRARLGRAVAGLDPHSLTPAGARAVLDALVAIEKLAAGARTLLAARAAEDGEWRRAGYRSRDEWLARTSGTTTGKARKTLEASEKLDDLPGAAEALRNGELSDEQAAAVIVAAAAAPSAEGRLLDQARGDGDVGHLKESPVRARARRGSRSGSPRGTPRATPRSTGRARAGPR